VPLENYRLNLNFDFRSTTMKRVSLTISGILGGLTAIVFVALSYLGNQIMGLPFVPYDIFDWMARHLPGRLITIVIDTMVGVITAIRIGPTASTAKLTEQGIAITQFVILGVVFGIVLGIIGRRRTDRLIITGAIIGGILCLGTILIEISLNAPAAGWVVSILWLIIIFLGWGAVLGRLILELAVKTSEMPLAEVEQQPPQQPTPEDLSRRQFLYVVGVGSVAILVGATGLRLLSKGKVAATASGAVPTQDLGKVIAPQGTSDVPAQSVLAARIPPAPGTRPELTSNDQFYRIDIDTVPPSVDETSWHLELGGLVDKPLSLSLADLRSRPSVTQAITLECISNELGGDLTSASLWTGVPFKDILAEAGLKPSVKEIAITSVDGFYESVPLNEAMDDRTLLVYEMNGEPLPTAHGFPLRIYIPNHYGMKQPKWISRMEAINKEGPGYWVDRGWSPTAIVQTTSVIDNVAVDQKDAQSNTVPVGGIAYAGARGISKVEVQVDNGPWEKAELRTPPLSPLTWVQWRYDWKATPGRHDIKVRAYDGQGQLQITNNNPTYPDGATGIYSTTADISSL
jgi:DMSO/TMAO reductase YedYZ molybdopterin-dependent catalytic subunit